MTPERALKHKQSALSYKQIRNDPTKCLQCLLFQAELGDFFDLGKEGGPKMEVELSLTYISLYSTLDECNGRR